MEQVDHWEGPDKHYALCLWAIIMVHSSEHTSLELACHSKVWLQQLLNVGPQPLH